MDIRDIARLSGYSLGTVSRVLNGHPNVSDKARMRVLKVVEEVGYEPNSNARFLKMQGRTAIVISHQLSTASHADSIAFIQDGEIIEQGSHAELIAARGEYYELERMQAPATTMPDAGDNVTRLNVEGVRA